MMRDLTPMITTLPILCGSMAAHPYRLAVEVHNAAYRELGVDYTFVYFGIDNPEKAVEAIKTLGIRGMNVSMPFKSAVIPFLDNLDTAARSIGAVNTISNNDGVLTGYNTDFIGAIMALQEVTKIRGRKVALLGAGGAARAVSYGLAESGADVTVFNRSVKKAEELAKSFKVNVGGTLDDFSAGKGFEILINCTSIGFKDQHNSPVPREKFYKELIVMDAVFMPIATKLLQEARETSCITIPGVRMLLHQACGQVELYTGRKAPLKTMERVITEEIEKMKM